MSEFKTTERTELKRHPERGQFDREQVYRILDDGLVCHVGFAVGGRPYVIPTGYARHGDQLFIHGAAAGRLMQTLGEGIDLCVTVTHLDGLVLARSSFSHSMNYRSVVIFGRGRVVEEPREKLEALRALTEHIAPGRWTDARRPNREELNETWVLAVPLEEVSAKVRTGPPLDKEADYELPVWAGVIPLSVAAGEPVADPRLPAGVEPPAYLKSMVKGDGLRD